MISETAAKNNIKTASVLAFERQLSPSDGIMYSCQWDNRNNENTWNSIPIEEKSVKGVIGNRLRVSETKTQAKLDASITNANLKKIDNASLGTKDDTLVVQFSLNINSKVGVPSACNNIEYRENLLQKVELYKKTHGLRTLAYRYAYNLANGRFLWRNASGINNIEIHIGVLDQNFVFDAKEFSWTTFDDPLNENTLQAFNALVVLVETALTSSPTTFNVRAYSQMGIGQDVYPSQELVLDEQEKKEKSRVLYHRQGCAAIHSQKIGNALRTIDDWYPNATRPVAVEAYASVTVDGTAYRAPITTQDFYTLFDSWVLKNAPLTLEQQHYVMAYLVRGGVMGDSDPDSDSEDKKSAASPKKKKKLIATIA